ncbi:Cu(I)-responsive transcriptional regulator [Acinetobacter sp. ULE_I001]|uniref:Cu(I)-responsive transcriptional regulator n=1 Tax=unclassified Acinetobacter TaxID=196816 RepID=UPI0030195393
MNIGKLSQSVGISAKMIRYYEQIGLIPIVGRSNAGYRSYTTQDAERLKFIRSSRSLGFSVAEIADLLDLWNNKNRQSADVKQMALSHIEKLEIRIQELQKMTNTLQDLINCCAGDERPNCPILDGLQQQKIALEETYHQNDSLSFSPLAQQKVKKD